MYHLYKLSTLGNRYIDLTGCDSYEWISLPRNPLTSLVIRFFKENLEKRVTLLFIQIYIHTHVYMHIHTLIYTYECVYMYV